MTLTPRQRLFLRHASRLDLAGGIFASDGRFYIRTVVTLIELGLLMRTERGGCEQYQLTTQGKQVHTFLALNGPKHRKDSYYIPDAKVKHVIQALYPGKPTEVYPMKVTRAQLATLSDYAARGGTFGTYLGTLKRHGLITELSRGEVAITSAGLSYLGITAPLEPQSSGEFITMWLAALRLGERKMLTVLIAAYPNTLTREELGTRIDMTATGGTFGTYLGTLRRNGLIEVEGDHVRASAILFDREKK